MKSEQSTPHNDMSESKETATDMSQQPQQEVASNVKDEADSSLENMLPADLAGKVIHLAPWTPIYRLEYSGEKPYTIELNAFSGNVSAKIPTGMPDDFYQEIMVSLQTGTVTLVDKLDDNTQLYQRRNAYRVANDQQTIDARIFVSELSVERLQEKLKQVTSSEFLSRCIDVESMEKNRSNVITAIKQRIQEIG